MEKKCKVLIAAGGSGGHLFPAQQLIALLKDQAEVKIAGKGLSKSPFFTRDIPFEDIEAGALKRGKLLSFMGKTLQGFFQTLRLLIRFSPDIVVGFGSYHTFPVLLASAVLRKKMILFEANCVLGKVNRAFSFAAAKIAIQFPLSRPHAKSVFVPLLPWQEAGKIEQGREEAIRYFGLDPHRKTILVFGGSQGASFLNQRMPQVITNRDWQVLHFTGKEKVVYPGVVSCVKEFESRMDLAYVMADVVVCRSGAGTLAELIRYRKPALLVPFPEASDNHQWENGRFLSEVVKGARLLKQSEASVETMREAIESLLKESGSRQEALYSWEIGKRIDMADLILREMPSRGPL